MNHVATCSFVQPSWKKELSYAQWPINHVMQWQNDPLLVKQPVTSLTQQLNGWKSFLQYFQLPTLAFFNSTHYLIRNVFLMGLESKHTFISRWKRWRQKSRNQGPFEIWKSFFFRQQTISASPMPLTTDDARLHLCSGPSSPPASLMASAWLSVGSPQAERCVCSV